MNFHCATISGSAHPVPKPSISLVGLEPCWPRVSTALFLTNPPIPGRLTNHTPLSLQLCGSCTGLSRVHRTRWMRISSEAPDMPVAFEPTLP